jgi:YfiH family protein
MPRRVEETRDRGAVPLWRNPEWAERFPWVVQATTGAGDEPEPFDLGLYGAQPVGQALTRWRMLREAAGMTTAIHARQVHGVDVRSHDSPLPAGLIVMDGFDGHITKQTGTLLAVSVADCVPVFLIDAGLRIVAMLHAGWRGVADGMLEAGFNCMRAEHGSRPADMWLHLGPAICGICYEVGPDVHRAVDPDRDPPDRPTAIDLRAALAGRANALGVPADQCTVSAHCTLCGPGEFFSHRAGRAERQMGVLAVRG